jgi:hypothetical protein
MGRPLSKKYFGNRNPGLDGDFGAQNQAGDAGLGGTGIASIDVTYPGDGWTTQPTYTVAIPTLPDGIRAEVVPHYQALSAATLTNGKGYNYHDTFALLGTYGPNGHGNGQPGYANATVSAITAVGVTMVTAGDHYADGDILEYCTGQGANVTIRVNTVASGVDAPAASLTIVSGGTRTSAKPTGTLGYQNTLGGTGVTFTLDWGVYSVDVADPGTETGDYTTFPTNPVTAYGTATAFFTPATFTLTSGLRSITVTNPGTGYVVGWDSNYIWTAAEPFVNFSGTAYQAPNYDVRAQRNSYADVNRGIFAYGYQAGMGLDDSDVVLPVDIIKQQSSRRYKVRERKWKLLTAANYGTLTANNTSGAFTISTPQPAGTFVVGELLVINGTLGGIGSFNNYYPGNGFQITATNGTSTFTLERNGNPIITTAGAITGATLASQTAHDTVIERSAQLVGRWPAAHDEIAIIATDSSYSLYFVTKLTARRALLVPVDYFNDEWHFPANEPGVWPEGVYRSAGWTMNPAVVFEAHNGEEKVLIGNYDIFSGP